MNKWQRFLEFFGCSPIKDGKYFFDGASFHATCKRCGKEIMQDSQGGWF